ncbi:PREDICTED: uncharacterized protein LOC108558920 isoform X2 [Nicrophorus vespilloides]|uniref:Uncharacterized protein LOC108558920 isoform X2 n=1 Tax=Nicrophorus vespilloides TaxID=110193 RepID=A0ABM1MA76_NICVS|nr:PREDICTED: uncharacterized protein LOC108558920 isoform X2 [Nicrophorus vespilloides]
MEYHVKKLELEFNNLSINNISDREIEGQFLFSDEDLQILVRNIEYFKEDSLSSWTRSQIIDWKKVAFNEYTAEQCMAAWESLIKKQRHCRIISEIDPDIKEQTMEPISVSSKFVHKNGNKRNLAKLVNSFVSRDKKQIYKSTLRVPNAKHSSCKKSLTFCKREMKFKNKTKNLCNKPKYTITQRLLEYLQEVKSLYNMHGIDVLGEH